MMHRQETVECLRKFNARRKLKVSLVFRAASMLKSYLLTVHSLPHHRRKLPSWLELSMKVVHVGGPQKPDVLRL